MQYWQERNLLTQQHLTNKTQKQIEKQLVKYYSKSAENIINSFANTYQKVLDRVAENELPTPADLYKLDAYWQMQGQLKQELEQLGNKQYSLMFKHFTEQYIEIYNNIAIPSQAAYSTIDRKAAEQIINHIWCADGKSWSNRIWTNTNKLQEALNDGLIDCVITGKPPTELKEHLQSAFNVSYNNADMIVRTEISHIQTQAARDRYIDYGIQEVEVWADKDERRCKVCGNLHKKHFPIGG